MANSTAYWWAVAAVLTAITLMLALTLSVY